MEAKEKESESKKINLCFSLILQVCVSQVKKKTINRHVKLCFPASSSGRWWNWKPITHSLLLLTVKNHNYTSITKETSISTDDPPTVLKPEFHSTTYKQKHGRGSDTPQCSPPSSLFQNRTYQRGACSTQSLNWVLSFGPTSVLPPSWSYEWLSLCADWVSAEGSVPFDSREVSHTDPGSVEGASQLGKHHEGTQRREACMGVHLQYHLSDLWVCSLQDR